MTRPVRILINGFGRIGRTVLRQILTTCPDTFKVVAVNDIAPLETAAYLLRYDSTFGPYPGTVEATQNSFQVNGVVLPYWSVEDIAQTDLSDVDVVFECTGRATQPDIARAGLRAGAAKILISGPSDAAERTIVLGANEHELGQARVVSNASCTTNAIAPLLRTLDLGLGIARAHVTTIHCYTGSQPTVDKPTAALERSRAAAVSMAPTSTSAAEQTIRVLPELQGRLSVSAVRVPTPSVSAIDAVVQIVEDPDQDLKEFLSDAFENCPCIGLTEDAFVSTDMRARPESLIIALPETQITQGRQLRIFGWYDNEWGYAARMLDLARRMAGCEAERTVSHGAGQQQD